MHISFRSNTASNGRYRKRGETPTGSRTTCTYRTAAVIHHWPECSDSIDAAATTQHFFKCRSKMATFWVQSPIIAGWPWIIWEMALILPEVWHYHFHTSLLSLLPWPWSEWRSWSARNALSWEFHYSCSILIVHVDWSKIICVTVSTPIWSRPAQQLYNNQRQWEANLGVLCKKEVD